MSFENKEVNFIDEENWYAVYTKPRSEKKLEALLKKFSIEVYLPLLKLKKKWSDRTKTISVPLFTSYIFVKVIYRESYLKVLNLPHSVGFVKSYGNPAIIPESEIELIKSVVEEFPDKIKVLETEMLQKGNEVTIKTGPFAGRKAIVDRVKNETYVLLEIKTIQKVLKIEIKKENLDLEIKL